MKWRRPQLDPTVRDQLELQPRERVLAWADDGAGRLVVASDTALHLQREPPQYARIGWEEIERAGYDDGTLVVTLAPASEAVTLRVPVGQGRDLPVVVRDRVTASVVVDRFVPLQDETGVRVVGRRGGDGQVHWRCDLDPALQGQSNMQEAANEVLADLRREVDPG